MTLYTKSALKIYNNNGNVFGMFIQCAQKRETISNIRVKKKMKQKCARGF